MRELWIEGRYLISNGKKKYVIGHWVQINSDIVLKNKIIREINKLLTVVKR